jgi:hypothetical protein
MGLSDKFPFPIVNKSGFVDGRDFNQGMRDLRDFLRFYANMGAYVIHPDQIAGAMPSFAAALLQAQEVPSGWPIIFNLVPNTQYDEDVVVPQALVEEHDVYVMNPFEDYTDTVGTIEWTGSLTVPEIHTWPTRHKMLNLFGVQLKNFDLNLDSGWDVNMRRSQLNNLAIERTHQGEDTKLWAHDCLFTGNLTVRDIDSGSGNAQMIFSHCSINCGDNPSPSFILNGSYQVHFIQAWIHAFLSTGAGLFDLRPPIGSFNGKLNFVDTTFECWVGKDPVLAADAGNASILWEGMNTVQVLVGSPNTFDLGGFANTDGFPYCRLRGVMPLNPPRGTRASDDTVDYRDKTWSGAAWV